MRMHQLLEFPIFESRQQRMRMVRHYDPRKKIVVDTIKLQQRILNYVPDSMVFQKTTSVSLIKISFDPSLEDDLFLFVLELGLVVFASVR